MHMRAARGDAETVLGIMNVMASLGYGCMAVYALAAGGSWLGNEGDPWWPVASLFGFLPALVIAFGVLAAGVAIVALLAAVAVLRGRTWGCTLDTAWRQFRHVSMKQKEPHLSPNQVRPSVR
jgi:hypothetical protein